MGLDHLGPSSAVLLQFVSQSAQEPLRGPSQSQRTRGGSCGQADNYCDKRRKKSASQLGARNSKGTRTTLCSSASFHGMIIVVRTEQPPSLCFTNTSLSWGHDTSPRSQQTHLLPLPRKAPHLSLLHHYLSCQHVVL